MMESTCACALKAECTVWQEEHHCHHLFLHFKNGNSVNQGVCTADSCDGYGHFGILLDECESEAHCSAEQHYQQQRQNAVELKEVVAQLHVPQEIQLVCYEPQQETRANNCARAGMRSARDVDIAGGGYDGRQQQRNTNLRSRNALKRCSCVSYMSGSMTVIRYVGNTMPDVSNSSSKRTCVTRFVLALWSSTSTNRPRVAWSMKLLASSCSSVCNSKLL